MLKIDNKFLSDIGLADLPEEEKKQLLLQIRESLETRVGMRLAGKMSDQQLDEFEEFIDSNDEQGALEWLQTNFPNYPQVVEEELEQLKGEIKADAQEIKSHIQQGESQ